MIGGCTFARKAEKGDGYEYGVIEVKDYATRKESRTHRVLGVAPSLEEALRQNDMALEGQMKLRPNIEPQYWD